MSTFQLTSRERQALHLCSHGEPAAAVAELMDISPWTAKSTLTNARRKLFARNTTHAVALALNAGLIPPVTPGAHHGH